MTLQSWLMSGYYTARCAGAHLQPQRLGRLEQEDLKYEASLNCLPRPVPKYQNERGRVVVLWWSSCLTRERPWVPAAALQSTHTHYPRLLQDY